MNQEGPLLTTSWDDGHPLDMRLAELLHKYEIPATFYIPRDSEYGTLDEVGIRELSSRFEIGAHTINHVYLDSVSHDRGRQEIVDSRAWIESVTGQDCVTFCFPAGIFAAAHLGFVRDAGYISARTVELLSMAAPVRKHGVLVMPTTLQAQAHPPKVYIKNALKRSSYRGLLELLTRARTSDWQELSKHFLRSSEGPGGVLHLWGHSWEIDRYDQWSNLENVLQLFNEHIPPAQRLTNGEVARRFAHA